MAAGEVGVGQVEGARSHRTPVVTARRGVPAPGACPCWRTAWLGRKRPPRWAAPVARLYPTRSHDLRLRTARRIRM